jgi:uncharacterized membrane protein
VKFGYDRRRGEEGGSDGMAKWLIIIGIVLFVLGIAWPLLAKLGLGNLPGDIKLERKDYTFYFPVTTSILISLVITLVLWIFRR